MHEFLIPELLPWLTALAALFGLLWGSFLNVCIFRVVRDMSVVSPRSFCTHCETPIAWYDNVPVLSYVMLRGKCRSCQASIGIRYPLVEVVTAVLMASVVWRYGWSVAALKWAVFETLMIVLFWTDLDVQILPDEFTLSGIVIGAVFAFFVRVPSVVADVFLRNYPDRARWVVAAIAGALVIPLPLWGFAALYKKVRRLEGDPLGLGDVKLMCLIGVFFGLERAIPVFICGTIAGAIFGGIYVALKGRTAWQAEIPFGSFLCGAAGLAVLVINRLP